jgi:hypothetical protein
MDTRYIHSLLSPSFETKTVFKLKTTHKYCRFNHRMIMRILSAALVGSLTAQVSFGFQPSLLPTKMATSGRVGVVGSTSMNMAVTDEDRAAALSAYMVKALEEKNKAVRVAEAAKDAAMEDLKAELEAMKKSLPATSAAPTTVSTVVLATGGSENLMDYSKEELAAKVIQYQDFMKQYIVKAQDQKAKAVKFAELSVESKYQLLLGSAGTAAPSAPIAVAQESSDLFTKRNAAVSAAAAAGKSRWGDMEAQRAGVGAATAAAVNGAPAVPAAALVVPKEVLEADHGLRNDGGVGGLTLAERIAQGSKGSSVAAPAAPVAAATPAASPLYIRRNARVVAAAAAGKSRWGSEENASIQNLMSLPASTSSPAAPTQAVSAPKAAAVSSQPVAVPQNVKDADHGLRNDGGVGGLTLAERIAQGSRGSSGIAPAATTVASPPVSPLYIKRNARVVAAAAAGKSRWGSMENERIQNLVALPAGSTDSPPINGAGRVNLGAQFASKK